VSEKRASTGSYAKAEPKGGDPLARLSDHLGRLLGHADELLAEWQAHADGVRARLDVQAREAGAQFQEAVQDALSDAGRASATELQRAFGASAERLRADLERARQAAADLDAHMQRLAGGARPTSVDELRAALAGISGKLDALRRGGAKAGFSWSVILAASANLLVGAVLVLLWSRTAQTTSSTAPPSVVLPPAPVALAAAAIPDAPLPAAVAKKPPCAELPDDTAAKVIADCVSRLCGARIEPPVKLGGYAHVLALCKPEDGAGRDLLAALQSLERDRSLEKLACPPDKDGTVTVRWLLECGLPVEPHPPPPRPPGK